MWHNGPYVGDISYMEASNNLPGLLGKVLYQILLEALWCKCRVIVGSQGHMDEWTMRNIMSFMILTRRCPLGQ